MRLKIVWLAKLKDPIHINWGAIEESCEYCNTYHSHQDTNHCRQWVSQFQIERLTESAKFLGRKIYFRFSDALPDDKCDYQPHHYHHHHEMWAT